MVFFSVTAHNIIIRRSLVTKIRQFSSSSNTNGSSNFTQTKNEKTQPLESKEAQASSSKWNDFLFAFASKFPSTNQALSPGTKDASNFFSTLMGFFKQLVTVEENSGWVWRIKTDTTIRFGAKNQGPKKLNPTMKLSEEGLVVMMELTGFKKDELKLSVQQNWILVAGIGGASGALIADAVEINPEHLFDAKKVTAEFGDGYVKVTLPKGTQETMVYQSLKVKWA